MFFKLVKDGKSFKTPEGEYCLKYKLGETTKKIPSSLGIFCYDGNIVDPHRFELYKKGIRVYEVEGFGKPINSFKMCPFIYLKGLEKWYNISSNWDLHTYVVKEEECRVKPRIGFNFVPVWSFEGVVLFDSIRLIKDITNDH